MPYTHRELSLENARKTYLPSAEERSYWPKFTREHVATHATLKDGWCVIHERVYDITLFAITHPGFHNAGQVSTALAITRSLGADATEEFEYVHSRLAWKQLHDFQVGVIHRPDEDGPEMGEVDRPRVNRQAPAAGVAREGAGLLAEVHGRGDGGGAAVPGRAGVPAGAGRGGGGQRWAMGVIQQGRKGERDRG